MSLSLIFIKTGNSNWATIISGAFSAIGALVGGIIAGTLTLQGVTKTLARDKEEKFLDSYFQKYIIADEVSSELKSILNIWIFRENELDMLETFVRLKGKVDLSCFRVKQEIGGSLAVNLHRFQKFYDKC